MCTVSGRTVWKHFGEINLFVQPSKMGCSTSQAAKVESNTTIENGANEKAEEDRKYRK